MAIYAPKGPISDLKKINVKDSEMLENLDSIKYIYCDETIAKYLILSFYKDGDDKSDPSMIMQIEKFTGDNTKDKWLEYLGILVEEESKLKAVSDTIKIYITRTHTGDNSTTGTLRTDDGSINGYTVELPRGTDNECHSICTDNTVPFDCHCIAEGIYNFEINTRVYNGKDTKNHSLRISSPIPNGREGVLIHGGRDDAKGWSQGCILPMPNLPKKDCEVYGLRRSNTKDQSVDFTIRIIDWVKVREEVIRKNNKEIDNVVKQIIIIKIF